MESVIEFKLPALGENIEQGDLVRLMIAPGATVSEGQAVMELETDKAVVEVPSSISGTVAEILVKEGDKIKVGQVVFTADNGVSAAQTKETPLPEEPAKRAEKAQAVQASAGSSSSSPSITTAATAKQQPARPSQLESQAAPQRTRSTDAPAASEFRLQELGENISEGDLVRLMIAPGAKVSEGQPVMELETDKAVVEVPSSVSGVVNEVKVKEGERIKVG
jgi:pyruvate dehydrogenase E2 component (dihydrolipoamide acetyltransferase)